MEKQETGQQTAETDAGAKEEETGQQVEKTDAGAKEEEEPLYDITIPPGVPRTIIIDIAKRFDVEVVTRKERLYFANMDGDLRELLAFRGKLAVMKEVEKYLIEQVRQFIEQ
jgi:hypothetical protein